MSALRTFLCGHYHHQNLYTMNKFEEYYDYLVDYSVATEDEIRLVCCINGHNVKSLESILYARLGYRDFHQWLDLSCLNEQ